MVKDDPVAASSTAPPDLVPSPIRPPSIVKEALAPTQTVLVLLAVPALLSTIKPLFSVALPLARMFRPAPLTPLAPVPPVILPFPSVPSSAVAVLSLIVRSAPPETVITWLRSPVSVHPARSRLSMPRFSGITTFSMLSRSMTISVPLAVSATIASTAAWTEGYSVSPIRATGPSL